MEIERGQQDGDEPMESNADEDVFHDDDNNETSDSDEGVNDDDSLLSRHPHGS
jgi:hypothetical protein